LSAASKFSQEIVESEKMRLVRSEYLSVEQPRDPKILAGLGKLKSYIREEVLPSRDDEKLQVKGIALIGVPGTGKSLSARVIASLLQWQCSILVPHDEPVCCRRFVEKRCAKRKCLCAKRLVHDFRKSQILSDACDRWNSHCVTQACSAARQVRTAKSIKQLGNFLWR